MVGKGDMHVTSISPFPTFFPKAFIPIQDSLKSRLCGKMLTLSALQMASKCHERDGF